MNKTRTMSSICVTFLFVDCPYFSSRGRNFRFLENTKNGIRTSFSGVRQVRGFGRRECWKNQHDVEFHNQHFFSQIYSNVGNQNDLHL
jgi:hypothetical protein